VRARARVEARSQEILITITYFVY